MHEFAHLRGCEAAFPKEEFAGRQAAARAAIAAAGHDALVVTGPEAIYWLTGRQTAGYFAFQALLVPVRESYPCSCANSNCLGQRRIPGSTTSKPIKMGRIPPMPWRPSCSGAASFARRWSGTDGSSRPHWRRGSARRWASSRSPMGRDSSAPAHREVGRRTRGDPGCGPLHPGRA